MKKFLLSVFTAAVSVAAVQAAPASQILPACLATSISENGQWIVGQADSEGYLFIKDLKNDKSYHAGGNLTTDGTGYTAGLGRTIANDGTAIALVNGIPYYWTPKDLKGTWTKLPGEAVDGSAVVGSITPDGSMIVGSIGDTGTVTDDILMTNPVIWYRGEDGKFGEPVALPHPSRDFLGMVPQYLNLVSVSADGNVIGAIMTANDGRYYVPYIYTKDEGGNWSYTDVGSSLINPKGRVFPGYTPDFNLSQPFPEDYMTDQQIDAMWAAFPEWSSQEPQASLQGGDELTYLQFKWAAENFMNPDKRDTFLTLLEAWIEAARVHNKSIQDFIDFYEALREEGTNFIQNNTRISPDGKYAYFTSEKTVVINPELGEEGIGKKTVPVRVDVETGEMIEYSYGKNIVLASVAADYSVLCSVSGLDAYWPTPGVIFPAGQAEGILLPEFIQANSPAANYEWMEENMYQECTVGVTDSGALQYDDLWTVGIPYCSDDLSLIVCANATMYWTNPEYAEKYNFVSFLLNTGLVEEETPDNPENPGDSGVDSIVSTDGGEAVYYDLQGRKVANPAPGLYVKVAGGKATKVIVK